MKKFLLALVAFVSLNAYADTWVMTNQGGGEITLTSDVCKADNGQWTALKHAYSWTNKIYFEGCWAVIDGNVHVTWVMPDGTRPRRVYPITSFNRKS